MDIEPGEIMPPVTQETIRNIGDAVTEVFEGRKIKNYDSDPTGFFEVLDDKYGVTSMGGGLLDFADILDPKEFYGFVEIEIKKDTQRGTDQDIPLCEISLRRPEPAGMKKYEYEILEVDGKLEMHKYETVFTDLDRVKLKKDKERNRALREELGEEEWIRKLVKKNIPKAYEEKRKAREQERKVGLTAISELEAQRLLHIVQAVGNRGK